LDAASNKCVQRRPRTSVRMKASERRGPADAKRYTLARTGGGE
jgi:hypothetical protein